MRRVRKRLVAALLIGAVSGLGAWFVAAPPRATQARAQPDVDIETTASRARMDALIRMARAPDDQHGTPAAAEAGASAAESDDAQKVRCGFDQEPVFSEPNPDTDTDGFTRELPREIRPAGVGFTGAQQRVDAALRSTGSAYDNAMADWLDVGNLRPPRARLDALVQDALASGEASVYGLAIAACANPFEQQSLQPTSCGRLRASEWARRDAGNGVPWLYALQEADAADDAWAQREALRQLEMASRFDVHLFAGMAAVARLKMPAEADLAGQSQLVGRAIIASGVPPFSALTQRCRNHRDDAAVIEQCEAISRVLFEHSDTLHGRAIGGVIHRLVTGDSSRIDQAHREQAELGQRVSEALGGEAASPCEGARRTLSHFVRADQVGERRAIEERLAARAASAASR